MVGTDLNNTVKLQCANAERPDFRVLLVWRPMQELLVQKKHACLLGSRAAAGVLCLGSCPKCPSVDPAVTHDMVFLSGGQQNCWLLPDCLGMGSGSVERSTVSLCKVVFWFWATRKTASEGLSYLGFESALTNQSQTFVKRSHLSETAPQSKNISHSDCCERKELGFQIYEPLQPLPAQIC